MAIHLSRRPENRQTWTCPSTTYNLQPTNHLTPYTRYLHRRPWDAGLCSLRFRAVRRHDWQHKLHRLRRWARRRLAQSELSDLEFDCPRVLPGVE